VPPTGIIVAQLGGPETLDDVEPFIRSIFADPHLVPLPGGPRTRSVLSSVIARARAPRSRANYAAIGGGSPIVATTQAQADALEAELVARGRDVIVAVAQRHSRPDTARAIATLLAARVDRIVLLPLFPQFSMSTTGSSEAELRRVAAEYGLDVPVVVIRSWCDHPSYLDAQARLVDEMFVEHPAANDDSALLVFSAHGLPQRIVDRGDPYPEEIEASVAGVMERISRPIDRVIAYQSRAGPMKWIGPAVTDVVKSAAEEGRTWLGVVPIAFVSEHVETTHELDIELAAIAAEAGVHGFHRSRCFNDDPIVGPMLADITEAHL
jgi:protoporphyrin/coproporphyrin ferrochelatase